MLDNPRVTVFLCFIPSDSYIFEKWREERKLKVEAPHYDYGRELLKQFGRALRLPSPMAKTESLDK